VPKRRLRRCGTRQYIGVCGDGEKREREEKREERREERREAGEAVAGERPFPRYIRAA